MVKKFEVGKVYYANTSRWAMVNGKEKIVSVKDYFLCTKRNDATGYVSFTAYYKGVLTSKYTRKIEMEYDRGKPTEEFTKIGYGGSGAWRNWYFIRASQKRD